MAGGLPWQGRPWPSLTLGYGHPPWLALLLASTATYGLLKKLANVAAVPSLTVESLFLAPVALGFLLVMGLDGHFDDSPGQAALFAVSGV